jgi:hypothetical protein
MATSGGHNLTWRPYGKYVKQTSILHVVSEKKIFEISANQRLLWPLAAILDNRSEQKVTTIDQNLVRNISAKYGSNPSSGS